MYLRYAERNGWTVEPLQVHEGEHGGYKELIARVAAEAGVDEAFLRRFRVVVDFPFPEAGLRERIWRVVFPPETPLGDLDYVALSRLALSGGFIRSIALSAAFMAAGEGGHVTMPLLGRAARQEYTKLGKSVPESQMRAFQ